METRAHYVAVGGFVLALVSLAFIAVLWLARFEFTTQYSYYDIYFTGPVNGLSEGSAVTYNGIRVGRVVDIRIDPENVERIRVMVELEQSVIIKTDAVAGLETNLLSGVSFIQIRGGTQEAPVLTAAADERYPVIQSRRSSLERVYSRAPQLLERLIDVADNLNSMLDDHNRKALADTLDNLRSVTGNVAERNKDVAETITNADAALAELGTVLRNVDQSYSAHDGLKDQLTVLLTDYDKLARGLSDTNHQLQLAISDVRPGVHDFTQRTISQFNDLIADTRQLVSGLTRLSSEIERDPTRFLFGDRREGYHPR
ncbi:MAG: MCE family protein [Alphaproteobacteria bacterium]|nr:MCE family protein [Alphaproteobacteria bacterium]